VAAREAKCHRIDVEACDHTPGVGSLLAALKADSLGLWIRRQRPANGARPRASQMAGPDGNDDDELGRARRSQCGRRALAQQQIAVEPRRFVAAHLPSPAYPPTPASNMWLKRLKPTQHSDARPCQSVGVQNNPASAATPGYQTPDTPPSTASSTASLAHPPLTCLASPAPPACHGFCLRNVQRSAKPSQIPRRTPANRCRFTAVGEHVPASLAYQCCQLSRLCASATGHSSSPRSICTRRRDPRRYHSRNIPARNRADIPRPPFSRRPVERAACTRRL
jgi:hypothetical protein